MLSIESKMEVFAKTYSKDTGVEILMGHNYCTDGKRIWVVPISDQADPELRKKTEVIVYHETGHIKADDVKSNPKDRIKQRIYNWVRDVAVEHNMETEYPGMRAKWAEFLVAHLKESNTKPAPQEPIYNKIMRALYLTCRGKQVGVDLTNLFSMTPEVQELFDKKFAQYIDTICKDGSVKNSLAITEEIYKSFTEEEKEQPKDDNSQDQKQKGKGKKSSKKDESAGAGDDGDPSEVPEDLSDDGDGEPEPKDEGDEPQDGDNEPQGNGADDNSTEPEDNDEGSKTGDADGDEDGDSDPDDSGAEDDPSSSGQTNDPSASDDQPDGSSSGNDEPLTDEAKEALEQAKDEIDQGDEGKTIAEETTDELNEYVKTNKVYRTEAGLKDIPQPVPKSHGWEYRVAESEVNGRKIVGFLGGKMKRLFISERAPVWQRNLRSGKLDIKKTWKVALGSQDIMRRKTQGIYEDACVYEVIDHSSSMNGLKGQIAQGILTAVSSDLDKLRIPFGAVGFTYGAYATQKHNLDANEGVRSQPATLNHIKGFNEPYRAVRHRFVWPSNTWGTAELPGIEFAARQLAMRRETKKILFILTDGETSTGNGILDDAMRTATKEFIERMLRAGVKVVGIGIQDRHMEEYCPDFIHVTDLKDFAHDFYVKLMKLIL